MSGTVKISDLDGKNHLKKEEMSSLRGKIVVLDTEQSEIAKNLGIKEKGVYGSKFK